MKNRIRFFAAVIIGIAVSLNAADIYWTNRGGDQVWTNAANWTGNIPSEADAVRLNKAAAVQPVFSDGMNETVKSVFIGMAEDSPAGFKMTGGKLTVLSAFEVNKSDTAKHQSIFEMSGGTLTVNGNFRIGWNDNDAAMNMTDGLITAEYGNVGEKALLAVRDGTIDIHWNWMMDAGSRMDMQKGILIVRNVKREDQLRSYIDAGNITAYGGTGTVRMIKEGGRIIIMAGPSAL